MTPGDRPRLLAAVALGGALGALAARQVMAATAGLLAGVGRGDAGLWGTGPLSTLHAWAPLFVLNIVGAFALGMLHAAAQRRGPHWRPGLVAGLGTGFLGAFTTISAVAVLVVVPLQRLWEDSTLLWGADRHLPQTLAELLLPSVVALLVLVVLSTLAAALGLKVGGAPRRADLEVQP